MKKETVALFLRLRRMANKPLGGWSVQSYRGFDLEVSPDGGLVYLDCPSMKASHSFDTVLEAQFFVDCACAGGSAASRSFSRH